MFSRLIKKNVQNVTAGREVEEYRSLEKKVGLFGYMFHKFPKTTNLITSSIVVSCLFSIPFWIKFYGDYRLQKDREEADNLIEKIYTIAGGEDKAISTYEEKRKFLIEFGIIEDNLPIEPHWEPSKSAWLRVLHYSDMNIVLGVSIRRARTGYMEGPIKIKAYAKSQEELKDFNSKDVDYRDFPIRSDDKELVLTLKEAEEYINKHKVK